MTTVQDPSKHQELANLDLSKVAALQQKRTLAFVNHFVATTVQFLNHFTKQCEQKLLQFERKLEKVEAAVVLLETRLSSIPEVNTPTNTPLKAEEPIPATLQASNTTASTSQPEDNPAEPAPSSTETSNSPEYDKFVKMVHVGVPLQAVKLKVSLEGLDPELLEKILGK